MNNNGVNNNINNLGGTTNIPTSIPASVPTSVPASGDAVPTITGIVEEKKEDVTSSSEVVVKKKKSLFPVILIFIIIGLIFYIVYSTTTFNATVSSLRYNCTPINSSKEETKLDLNSTLVKDLYSKVYTNIREDLAQPDFNDNMKRYLAFRQISSYKMYDTNCNLYNPQGMEPYKCEVSTKFVPKGFREEDFVIEYKKLFGEETEFELKNIKLENSCIGGYQYIPDRHEFVQGYCEKQTASSFKVTKTLKDATTTRNTIILVEDVKYKSNEKLSLPEYLKSGTYYYTFRLDMNFNYVLVSKTYDSKY